MTGSIYSIKHAYGWCALFYFCYIISFNGFVWHIYIYLHISESCDWHRGNCVIICLRASEVVPKNMGRSMRNLALLLSNQISFIHGSRIKLKITLLPTISHLHLPNFVSCGRACPSHMTHNLVTVGAKLWTAECFLVDPWSMDYADPVW